MSWDSYLNMLMEPDKEGNFMEKGAIWGFSPISKWTQSKDFDIKEDEIGKLNAGDTSSFASNGVYLAGTKFMLVRNNLDDPDFACLQLRSSNMSATVAKIKTAYVIGVGRKDVNAGRVSSQVYSVANYLKEKKY